LYDEVLVQVVVLIVCLNRIRLISKDTKYTEVYLLVSKMAWSLSTKWLATLAQKVSNGPGTSASP
jgi:hypothetical protein